LHPLVKALIFFAVMAVVAVTLSSYAALSRQAGKQPPVPEAYTKVQEALKAAASGGRGETRLTGSVTLSVLTLGSKSVEVRTAGQTLTYSWSRTAVTVRPGPSSPLSVTVPAYTEDPTRTLTAYGGPEEVRVEPVLLYVKASHPEAGGTRYVLSFSYAVLSAQPSPTWTGPLGLYAYRLGDRKVVKHGLSFNAQTLVRVYVDAQLIDSFSARDLDVEFQTDQVALYTVKEG